jgi:tetratricopeptide (TPR) repeat protein
MRVDSPEGCLRWHRALALSLLLTVLTVACGRAPAAPVVTAPRYPDYIVPTLPSPAAAQDGLVRQHDAAWRWLQAGDLPRSEAGFQSVLKRSPQFYPSETALGYLNLARSDFDAALTRFDHVLQSHPDYLSAVAGRGEALLGLSRETDALAAFEVVLKLDPQLQAIARRVEVLRARALQENVAAARRASQANRLDEAARLYAQALAASPGSAFLIRDLADIEVRQGKADEALTHYRRAIELDPSDAVSRMRIGEVLDARGDLEGALTAYNEANAIEPSDELRRRLSAIEARIAYLKLPAEYRSIPEEASTTRGALASLIGIRLEPVLRLAVVQPIVITDARTHWAADWIMAAAQAGVMEPYENHTFQPRNPVMRSDLAMAVARLLKIVASGRPALLKDWQGRQQKMADVGVSNLHYADASLSVAAGILPLTDSGQFQLSRPVSGAEAVDAISRLERLYASSR